MNTTIEYKVLIPNKSKFKDNPADYIDITEHDTHPSKNQIATLYGEFTSAQSLRCGDVIKISSVYYQFCKYYFVARNGLEEIEW